ncbi:hypothetical protein [Microbacterium sp. 77mftsu3.1]|uniref:hypothetical protein n=1 Tax=Microbacterium sp. 77mftsu3.1 TaxID=1761802 RepID=UPI0003AA399D|nr:hypothetical protein [Microbacterium sp. 77mftsu3.1]SDH31818.1 hypothetical protein SAMN04488590_3012 [Microbacterium sp. 77mftsu3.1]
MHRDSHNLAMEARQRRSDAEFKSLFVGRDGSPRWWVLLYAVVVDLVALAPFINLGAGFFWLFGWVPAILALRYSVRGKARGWVTIGLFAVFPVLFIAGWAMLVDTLR